MEYRIAINDCSDSYIEALKQYGLEVDCVKLKDWNEETIIEALRPYDIWISICEPITRKVCRELSSSLKYICRNGVGYDCIDVKAATEYGICCSNTPGTMDECVAEAALLLILESARRFYISYCGIRDGKWIRDYDGVELEGKTVGLVGFGRISRKVRQYLTGFNCRVLVYDPYCDAKTCAEFGVEKVSLRELARESDFVSIHCMLSDDTYHMIDKTFLKEMKKTAYLINTARGGIVDQAALIEALECGEIAGAGLDVIENEPLEEDSQLRHMNNVYLTAHIGSATLESRQKTLEATVNNLKDFIAGRVPAGCLNPQYTEYVKK